MTYHLKISAAGASTKKDYVHIMGTEEATMDGQSCEKRRKQQPPASPHYGQAVPMVSKDHRITVDLGSMSNKGY
jgi:hypothetical protein